MTCPRSQDDIAGEAGPLQTWALGALLQLSLIADVLAPGRHQVKTDAQEAAGRPHLEEPARCSSPLAPPYRGPAPGSPGPAPESRTPASLSPGSADARQPSGRMDRAAAAGELWGRRAGPRAPR